MTNSATISTILKRETKMAILATLTTASKHLKKLPLPLRRLHHPQPCPSRGCPSYVHPLPSNFLSFQLNRLTRARSEQPVPSFEDLDASQIHSLTAPYLDALFPPADPIPPLPPLSAKENPVFLTPRSASLWSQLVAPPPLQPPDWIRSRIRRLFLVSLGVPVDLDEILPASSKQKKLVLPSVHLRRPSSSGSLRRASTDSRGLPSRARNASPGATATTSVDADRLAPFAAGGGKGKKAASDSGIGGGGGSSRSSSSRKVDPEQLFDLVSARRACIMTDAALDGMTDGELRAHVARLEAMQTTARGVLEYWQKRTDEKIGDREAFEGVIENLVKHARKVRK